MKTRIQQQLAILLAIGAGFFCGSSRAQAQTYSQGLRYLLTISAVEGSLGGMTNYDSGFVLTSPPLIGAFNAAAGNSYCTVTNTVAYGALTVFASCGIAAPPACCSGLARFIPEIAGTPMILSDDRLVITSATLTAGTPVQVQVTCIGSGYFNQSFAPSQGYGSDCGSSASARIQIAQGSTYTHDVSASLGSFGIESISANTSNSMSVIVNTRVGDSFTLIPQLYASGEVVDGYGGSNGVASITENATLATYANVLTPGADYTADSSTVYPVYQAPPPMLSIQTTDNGVVLSWPAICSGYGLQQTLALATVNWVSNTNPVSLVNGTNQVAIIPASGNMLYRLVHP